jgi:rubrerythrin
MSLERGFFIEEGRMEEKERDIIELAIQMEKDGIEFYNRAADEVENPLGKKMFKSVVEDEKRHLAKLKSAFARMEFSDVGEEKAKELFGKIKTIFSEIPPEVMEALDAHSEELDVIKGAMRMEEEGIKFYAEKCIGLQGKAGELCSFILQEEKNHRNILQNTLEFLEENRNWNVETEHWFFEG